MSKHKDFKLISSTTEHLSRAIVKAAETKYRNTSQDNSPKLDAGVLSDTVETVSALNLGDLSHELVALSSELPLLAEATYKRPLDMTREGYLMAVMFEAGRRYMLLQAVEILTEEVEILPTEASSNDPLPLLEA